MDDVDVQFHSGIPVGHKFLAILLALAVGGAGCAWLIYQSRQSASAAVLAVNPALAQQLDSGIASARHPAIALADFMLNDQTVARLAQQAHLASSTPAGQIGEFRSDLDLRSAFQISQPSVQQLQVRFHAPDPSQSSAITNSIAQALATWTPAAAAATPPPASSSAPVTAVPQSAPQSTFPDQATSGQAHPGPAPTTSSLPALSAQTQLSADLRKLSAQLSATDRQVTALADGSIDGGEPPSYIESREQSLLRSEVRQAQRGLAGFHHSYAKELADPAIAARVDEMHQALDSILAGGSRHGFNAAGVSTGELRAERSELRQAIQIVDRETSGVEAEKAAHPVSSAQPAETSTPSPQPTMQTASTPSSSAPAQSSPSPIAEQNIGPATSAVPQQTAPPSSPSNPAAQPSVNNPWSIVHLAAPASRPPLWPALVAGALCGLLYLGIAAFVYRRGASEDIYPELRSAPQRMITPAESVRIADTADEQSEPLQPNAAPRQRAAFVFQSAPRDDATASGRNTDNVS